MMTNKITKRLTPLLIAWSLGCISSPVLADIYKITEPDGSITFTDRLPEDKPFSSNKLPADDIKIETVNVPNRAYATSSRMSSNTNMGASQDFSRDESSDSVKANKSLTAKKMRLYTVEILTPEKVRAYHKPAESIEVKVDIKPALGSDDNVVIFVDNERVGEGMTTTLPTLEMNPGEHTLTVKIISKDGRVLKTTTMPFYIIQSTNG